MRRSQASAERVTLPDIRRQQLAGATLDVLAAAGLPPFGGPKQSGLGRENGRAAIGHHTQLKSVHVALADVEAPY